MAPSITISADLQAAPPGPWPAAASVNGDLLAAKQLVYDPSGFTCSMPVPEAESAEYGAHGFTVDGRSVRFRMAKTTPTKVGQFVTLWKRLADGPIMPFGEEDAVDLFIISSRMEEHFGQFVFPRQELASRNILSRNGAGGKRGFRVYPPWVTTASKQASLTQAWQNRFFLHIATGRGADPERARMLFRS